MNKTFFFIIVKSEGYVIVRCSIMTTLPRLRGAAGRNFIISLTLRPSERK